MSEREFSPSDLDKILKEETKVLLGGNFVASVAEIEWAKEEIANSPEGTYLGIADAIAIKRGIEQFERGEYEVYWQC